MRRFWCYSARVRVSITRSLATGTVGDDAVLRVRQLAAVDLEAEAYPPCLIRRANPAIVPAMTCLRLLTCVFLAAACGGRGGSSANDTMSSTPSATATEFADAATTSTGVVTTSSQSSQPMTTSTAGPARTTGPSEMTSTSAGETSTSTGPGEMTSTAAGETSASTGPGETTSTSSSETGTVQSSTNTEPGETGDSSSGGSTTGDPVGTCKELSGDYGKCLALLGIAFVDGACRAVSGCDCEPDCEFFFDIDDPAACASTCAAAGECNEDIVKGAGIADDPIGPGSLCDELNACASSPELEQAFQELFPELVCEQGNGCDGQNCHLLFQNVLTPEQWQQICAASLLPGVSQISCWVFGP